MANGPEQGGAPDRFPGEFLDTVLVDFEYDDDKYRWQGREMRRACQVDRLP